MPVRVSLSGISLSEILEVMNRFPAAVETASRIAVNDSARFARRIGVRQMTREVNFPRGYLDTPGRFEIVQFATRGKPEAIVRGRGRATSLRRFALGAPTPESTRMRGAGGVAVQVKPGHTVRMAGAFVVRLRAGASITDDNFNLGLAVRLKPGERLRSKYKYSYTQLSHNAYVLYGPSVAQVFDTVRHDILPEVTSELGHEFVRQFPLQLRK